MAEVKDRTTFEVPFFDVDAMQIVWHGHYVKYMEVARCHLLDQIEYNYQQMKDSGYSWPVIELKLKYVKPLKFKQQVEVIAEVVEAEYGLKIKFGFFDVNTGEKLTSGYTKQVAVEIESGEMCLLSPPILAEKINTYIQKTAGTN